MAGPVRRDGTMVRRRAGPWTPAVHGLLRPLYPDAERQSERFALFCDAYGLSGAQRTELLRVSVQRTKRMWRLLVENSNREPYATLVRDGHAEFWRRVAQHVERQVDESSTVH